MILSIFLLQSRNRCFLHVRSFLFRELMVKVSCHNFCARFLILSVTSPTNREQKLLAGPARGPCIELGGNPSPGTFSDDAGTDVQLPERPVNHLTLVV